MRAALEEGVATLRACEDTAQELQRRALTLRAEPDAHALAPQLERLRARIHALLKEANQGLLTIENTNIELDQQLNEMNKHEEILKEIDNWLSAINSKLDSISNPKTTLQEKDIINIIEILERHLEDSVQYENNISTINTQDFDLSLKLKLDRSNEMLKETRKLIEIQIEQLHRLRAELCDQEEEDIQTDRTIDSSPMPEEVAISSSRSPTIHHKHKEIDPDIQYKSTNTIETQTGKSLVLDPANDEDKITHDIAISCAVPVDVHVQTSESNNIDLEQFQNIKIKQTVSEGHETIEIANRPVIEASARDDSALLIDAQYKDENETKESELNILHSLPQSFETVMVEPDETTTEVFVDADGTKRIIVKKIRKTVVSRQQTIQSHQHSTEVTSGEGIPEQTSFSQIVLRQDEGFTTTKREDGSLEHVQHHQYGGRIVSSLPGGEVTIQEFTSKPDVSVVLEESYNPDDILAKTTEIVDLDPNTKTQIHKSSSSVTALVQQVTKKITRTRRRIIRRVVLIDGKEHVTEEIIEEPDSPEIFEEDIPKITINLKKESNFSITEVEDDKNVNLSDDFRTDKKTNEEQYPTEVTSTEANQSGEKMKNDEPEKTKTTVDMTEEKNISSNSELSENVLFEKHADIICDQKNVSENMQLLQNVEPKIEEQVHNEVNLIDKMIVRKRKRIIRRVVLIDGKEHVTEEIVEEPDNTEVFEDMPKVTINLKKESDLFITEIGDDKNVDLSDDFRTERTIHEERFPTYTTSTNDNQLGEDMKNYQRGTTKTAVDITEEKIPESYESAEILEIPKSETIHKDDLICDDKHIEIINKSENTSKFQNKESTKEEQEHIKVNVNDKTVENSKEFTKSSISDDISSNSAKTFTISEKEINAFNDQSKPTKKIIDTLAETADFIINEQIYNQQQIEKEDNTPAITVLSDPHTHESAEEFSITPLSVHKIDDPIDPDSQCKPKFALISADITLTKKIIDCEDNNTSKICEMPSNLDNTDRRETDSEAEKIIHQHNISGFEMDSKIKTPTPMYTLPVKESEKESEKFECTTISDKYNSSDDIEQKRTNIDNIDKNHKIPITEYISDCSDKFGDQNKPLAKKDTDDSNLGRKKSSDEKTHSLDQAKESNNAYLNIISDELALNNEKISFSSTGQTNKEEKGKTPTRKEVSPPTEDEKSIEIKMSLETNVCEPEKHSLSLDMKIENYGDKDQNTVKRDIDVLLPSDAKISIAQTDNINKAENILMKEIDETLINRIEKDIPQKSKKKKKHKSETNAPDDSSHNLQNINNLTLENNIALQTNITPKYMSPEATELESQSVKRENSSNLSSSTNFEIEDIDYEPGESSVSEPFTGKERSRKKGKKKLPSVETLYPETTTCEFDDDSISIEPYEIKRKNKKKSKKKDSHAENITREIQNKDISEIAIEQTTSSPVDQYYQSFSEHSELPTVKIVEECTLNNLEPSPRQDLVSSVAFTVPVLEAVYMQEHSIQTSILPEESASNVRSEVRDGQQQTSLLPQADSAVQTQSILCDDIAINTSIDELILRQMDDATSQTTPRADKEFHCSEVFEKVNPSEEKYSQTSLLLNETSISDKTYKEDKEISAIPLDTLCEDKSIETVHDIVEKESQTVIYNVEDKETITSTDKKESSIQTTSKTVIDNMTQSDTFIPDKNKISDVHMSNTAQQTISTYDFTDDSLSTSTDEPFEIHLKTHITIPNTVSSTIELIDIEKSGECSTFNKKGNKKPKVHTYSPSTPESLSDPINAEMSALVTPTSGDESISQYTSSIDGSMSPQNLLLNTNIDSSINAIQKLSYSDVVRSKSKSPESEDDLARLEKIVAFIKRRTADIKYRDKNKSFKLVLYDPQVASSYNITVSKNLDQALLARNSTEFEKHAIVIIETISSWLEEIRCITESILTAKSDRIEEVNGSSKKQIDDIKRYVQNLKGVMNRYEINTDNELFTVIENLDEQISAVEQLKHNTQNETERTRASYTEQINILYSSIKTLKHSLEEIFISDISIEEKLLSIDQIDQEIQKTDTEISRLSQLAETAFDNKSKDIPNEIYACNEMTRQLQHNLNIERDKLLQISALAEEYEQTLEDFAQIADVADALLEGKIIVTDLYHLHEEIQKHRKFFVNLSHCRAILESLEENLDNETRLKYSSLHIKLHDRATVIIDRAANRAQQMTLAASRWGMLEQGMKEEHQWLRVVHQRIPDLANVTSIDHEQYINLYQSVNLDVMHHHAKLLRLLSIAESLQNIIECCGIHKESTESLVIVSKLQEDIETKLLRLIAFREYWISYDNSIDRIESWIKTANRDIQQIAPEVSMPSGNLRRFWELKAQHELHNGLKNDAGVQFERALEILPVSDEMVQRNFFSKLEDDWRDLSERIDKIQQAAIQTISDRDIPSSRKLDILEEELRELRALVDGLKGTIQNEDQLNLYLERLEVMSGRIERIRNELGRVSLLPVSASEAERLHILGAASRLLNSQISEELERSSLLKERILSIKSSIARGGKEQTRVRVVLEDCKKSENYGSDVVERALDSCERVACELDAQWQVLLGVRQALHALPVAGTRAVVSPVRLERDISALQDEHVRLESECSTLAQRLRERRELWSRFELQLEAVRAAVRDTDYMVELLTVQGQVDYERLLKATEKLEGLSKSMSGRSGALVGELKQLAAPLAASCQPDVAAAVQRDLDDAAAAYEDTCRDLNTLCHKYQQAVSLWRQYRDAAAAVASWTLQQQQQLPALAPNQAHLYLQMCGEQEERMREVQALATRVAADTGSHALQAETDALARQLRAVCSTVRALADIGEARQRVRARAVSAHTQLERVQRELPGAAEEVEKEEQGGEARLLALRDGLLALGRTETDLEPPPDLLHRRDDADETSIVRVLELWQQLFLDTFSHYHRLSSALVRSENASTALRLWREYLVDLQSFLRESIPDDYENLTEHRRLCEVHQKLLASQRSILLTDKYERSSVPDEVEREFVTLTDSHDETLARIVDRHERVSARITAWECYHDAMTRLMRWLKRTEREKEDLKLRYVHMKRVDGVLGKINELIEDMPTGRRLSGELLERLDAVLRISSEAYGASVRMEAAGVVKRVDNLQAGLETWRDYLVRIIHIVGEYRTHVKDLQNLYGDTQSAIISYSDKDCFSRPRLQTLIEKFGELKSAIAKTTTQLESLNAIQDQLKECLSPQDVRSVNQRVWQLRQQQADLEHQLSIIEYRLREKIDTFSSFQIRHEKFLDWLNTVEIRLEESSRTEHLGATDPHDLIKRLDSDIRAEMLLKEREYKWLVETGTTLAEISQIDENKYSLETQSHVENLHKRWNNLLESNKNRISKITQLIETIQELEERLSTIRIRLHTIEMTISRTVVLENLRIEDVDSRSAELTNIQKSIDLESGEIGETLNHCELVLNDPDIRRGNFDVRNLRTGTEIVEKKWHALCEASACRKKILRDVRTAIDLVNSDLPDLETRINTILKQIKLSEERIQRGDKDKSEEVISRLTVELLALEPRVFAIERALADILAAGGIELRGAGAETAARVRDAAATWRSMRAKLTSLHLDAHRKFVDAHGQLVMALAQADVRLTRAQHLPDDPDDIESRLKELDEVELCIERCTTRATEADRLAESDEVRRSSGSGDMVAEYRALLRDVGERLRVARAELTGDVTRAVQVDTLCADADVQVDTLTARDTYRAELGAAARDAADALEELRLEVARPLRRDAGADELSEESRRLSRALSASAHPLDLAHHLSDLLLTECEASERDALLPELGALDAARAQLQTQADNKQLHITNMRLPHSAGYTLACQHAPGRVSCPLCSERNWKQLDNELWRLEQWLQYAEAVRASYTDPPAQYDLLEDTIQEHREFLLDLDSHKSIVSSLNMVGAHVAEHAGDARAAAELRARLDRNNARWQAACAAAADRQHSLQHALLNNKQFHDIVVELVSSLQEAERTVRAREPLSLRRAPEELRRDFRRFSELRDELERTEPRVHALSEAAQLLRDTDTQDQQAGDVCRRLGELRLRLQSLRKLAGVYALRLGAALARHPSHLSSALAAAATTAVPSQLLLEEEEAELSSAALAALVQPAESAGDEEPEASDMSRVQRGLRFVSRVARASLPFQALLLLLLGAAALAPGPHSDSACRAPTLGFEPVLRFPDGPPPL